MRSSFHVATEKTALLFTFGFALTLVLAPSIASANVIINHLGIFARGNPNVEQGIAGGIVTEPVQPALESDESPADPVQLGLGANEHPQVFIDGPADGAGRKPWTFVPVTTPPAAETDTLDILFVQPPQTGSEIGVSTETPLDPVAVPEPGTLGLLAAAVIALGGTRRKV